MQSNAAQAHPEPLSPTEFTEQEINAHSCFRESAIAHGSAIGGFPGAARHSLVGTARVDSDQLKSGKNSYNPLLSVFSGVHEVVVTAHAYGAKGEGSVHVDSVSLDGVEVPAFVLEMFVEKYLKPEYPQYRHSTRALRCPRVWTRRPSGCTESP